MKKKKKQCFKCEAFVDKFHSIFQDNKGNKLIICNKCWNEFARMRISPPDVH